MTMTRPEFSKENLLLLMCCNLRQGPLVPREGELGGLGGGGGVPHFGRSEANLIGLQKWNTTDLRKV